MVSALLGAAGSIGGAVLGNKIAASSARAINDANIANQNAANAMEINLANTAHQREVADLRLAGLNPILSASGSGSSVPTLGIPDLTNPNAGYASLGDSFNAAGSHLGSGADRLLKQATIEAQVSQMYASADNTASQADLARLHKEQAAREFNWFSQHPEAFDQYMRLKTTGSTWQKELINLGKDGLGKLMSFLPATKNGEETNAGEVVQLVTPEEHNKTVKEANKKAAESHRRELMDNYRGRLPSIWIK